MTYFRIRAGQKKDIPLLKDVERSAAAAFLVLDSYVPIDRTVPSVILRKMVNEQKLWIAVEATDAPIGFLGCRDLTNIAYVHEISVAHKHQRRGVGRALLIAALSELALQNYTAVGLTTRRDAAWNMPFYSGLGFYELVDPKQCPALWNELQQEIETGADPAIRCAMIKTL